MKSLRGRLLVGLSLGIAAVLVAAGSLTYVLVRRAILEEFDAALANRTRALALLVENNEDGLEFELAESGTSRPAEGADDFYQIWRADGRVLARSASLAGCDLPAHEKRGGPAVIFEKILPNGQPGRLARLVFEPRRDAELGPADPPVHVTLAVARSTVGVQSTLSRICTLLIAVGAAALVLLCAITLTVVRRSLRPVQELGREIASLNADRLATRICGEDAPKELAPIVARLNELLSRLEAAFVRERRFTGDAAHELRTPLAGLRSKLELALSRDRTPEAYQAALRDCLAIDLQMQRLVETLLELARADAGLHDLLREDVDVSELVRARLAPLAERVAQRGLAVECRLAATGTIRTDRERLALVIDNVLENAVSHANEGGRALVATSNANGMLELSVTNTGNRVPPDQVQHVFDRFWRGDLSRSLTGGHVGLGLSLCKAVIEGLGGSIRASVSGEREFTIEIQVPRAG